MLAECEWQPERPGVRTRGYQLSALYSPWVKWRDLAEQWAKAHANRDKRGLQEFINLRLGETWIEEGHKVDAESLEKNRETYDARVPAGVLLLTCGVDVQDNRLEAEVVGWGAAKESWGIHYEIIPGDTTDLGPLGPWAKLDEFLQRTWARADGTALRLWCVCVDSGGHRTSEVYTFCRDRIPRNVFAIKGRAGEGHPIIAKPTITSNLRIPLFLAGVDAAKGDLYSQLANAEPGPGYCHFPRDREANYDSEYFHGLCSEKRVPKIRAGRRHYEWKQVHSRNEPLDCRVYSMAALEIIGPEYEKLAAQYAPTKPAAPTGMRPQQPRRRVLSKGLSF